MLCLPSLSDTLSLARLHHVWLLQVARQIGEGLTALHRKGIIHRDVKPQNVLLTDDDTARISDMGLCKRLTNEQSYAESATIGALALPKRCQSKAVDRGRSKSCYADGATIDLLARHDVACAPCSIPV